MGGHNWSGGHIMGGDITGMGGRTWSSDSDITGPQTVTYLILRQ